jgi:hypothetical protein
MMRKVTCWTRSPLMQMNWNDRKKITAVRNKVEDLIQRAKSSNQGLNFLLSNVMNIESSFDPIIPNTVQGTQQEYECFIGCKISEQIEIHPPTNVHSKGRSKRIRRAKELSKSRKRKNFQRRNH